MSVRAKKYRSTTTRDGLSIISPGNPATLMSRELQIVAHLPSNRGIEESEIDQKNLSVFLASADSKQTFDLKPKDLELLPSSDSFFRLGISVDFSEVVPPSESFEGQLWLELGCDSLGVPSTNSIGISLSALDSWNRPFGGFFSPETSLLASEILPISAWAIKGNESAESAVLNINGKEVGELLCSVDSPELFQSLPSFQSSKTCRIAGLFNSKEVEARIPKLSEKVALQPSLRVRFPTGEETFQGSKFFWKRKEIGYQAVIESMNYSVLGGVLVKGSVITSDSEPPLLVARSSKLVKELEDWTPGVSLSWLNREDLTWFDPANRFRSNFGFELNIDPNVFGYGAGKIEIHALTRSGYQPVGSFFQWLKLGKMMDDFSSDSRLSLFFKRSANSLLPQAIDCPSLLDTRETRVVQDSNKDLALFCSHNLNPCEGAPRVLADVALRYADEKGADNVKVISAREGELTQTLSEKGIEVEVIEELESRSEGWTDYLSGFEKAEESIRKFSPARVFANTLDCFWAVRLANLLDIDSIWTIHESSSPVTFGLNLDSRQRLHFFKALEQVDQSIFVSEASRQVFGQWIDQRKSKVIPNGVDLELCSALQEKYSRIDSREKFGLRAEDHLVLTVGTVTPRKGQDIVLKAARELISGRSRRNLRFFFVGGRAGDFQDQLFRDCQAWGLEEHVEFVNETSEVAEYYSAADTVVIASREESAPLVSLEAMAWGKPLVSTSVFGLSEQLEDGHTALLYASEDSEGLARGIETLLDRPSLGLNLANNAQSEVQARFDIHKSIEAYTDILYGG